MHNEIKASEIRVGEMVTRPAEEPVRKGNKQSKGHPAMRLLVTSCGRAFENHTMMLVKGRSNGRNVELNVPRTATFKR